MNTLTFSSATRTTSGQYGRAFEEARTMALPGTRPMPTWLPVPKPVRVAPRLAPGSTLSRKAAQGFRCKCAREFQLERIVMLLLACVGLIAIVYGFSNLIDLVQHWAVFNAGVERLIQ